VQGHVSLRASLSDKRHVRACVRFESMQFNQSAIV
jgi:hypothetical protein